MWILAELLGWGFGYAVGRRVLPLVSFGKVQAGHLESQGYNWLGYKRNVSGRLEIDSTLVAGIGLIACCIVLAAILHFIH